MLCIKQGSCLEHFMLQGFSHKGALKHSGECKRNEGILRGHWNFCGFRVFQWKDKCDSRIYWLSYFQWRYKEKKKA